MSINKIAEDLVKNFDSGKWTEVTEEQLAYFTANKDTILEIAQKEEERKTPYYEKVTVEHVKLMYVIKEYMPYSPQMKRYHTNLTCHKCNRRFQDEDMVALAVTYGAENQCLCQGCAQELLTRYPELSEKTRISEME